MKRVLFIARQSLVAVLFLQLLNLSVCSESYLDCSVLTTHDPTETIVEWVVEWKKGNQDIFTYSNNINLKGLSKNFSWNFDVQHSFPSPMADLPTSPIWPVEISSHRPIFAFIDILSPPPELQGA